ncbi:peptidoglycan glycosyltransferase [Marispirochaeta aestuarii]|uniref:Peptidoglycan glycosyltransferase n=1 Tax=Marispirochaeta aestuarii TaxID=1963862 RepID=A0A1Y1RVZ2_9SPIO|nr:penicillin-binding transpeptidase domain-containing protein [Marispirochaeta aestuarii]ORC34247.1 peptidoglycan glycosyltransferase [Marispirochaeta aestuarii]
MIEKQRLTRFIIFAILTAMVIVFVVWRYTAIMLFSSSDGAAQHRTQGIVERGPILDRDGRILAIQTQLDTVTAWMPSVSDPEKTYNSLVRVLDLDKEELQSKFETRSGFFYVKRKISRSESRSMQELLSTEDLKGISLIPEYGRAYPEKKLASHVVGYAGTDNVGLLGIEYTYDKILYPPPEPGRTRYGNQLFLTIDVNLQHILEELATESFEENKPESITLIAAEAKTGEILAYVSIPGFDPNTFSDFSPQERVNVPATTAYEPGSVFKVFSIASFLELGGIAPETTFFCGGSYDNVEPHINCLGYHGLVNAEEILKKSCNAGAGYASETVTEEDFYSLLTAFGFGTETGIPFPGETNGIFRNPQNWSERTKPTIAMGQEISVSALQIIQAASTFANDGVMLRPMLVKKIVSPEGKTLQEFQREPVRQVVSSHVAREILMMMESVTQSDGTAHRAAVEGMRISAKTGTAQLIDPSTGKYSEEDYVASCLALFPSDDPRIILYAAIHKPKGPSTFGGRIAAPLVGKAAEEVIRHLGIPREGDRQIDHPGRVQINVPSPLRITDTLPDLTGRPKRDLLPLYKIPGAVIEIRGEGWVSGQSPAPGTPIREGMHIVVELE